MARRPKLPNRPPEPSSDAAGSVGEETGNAGQLGESEGTRNDNREPENGNSGIESGQAPGTAETAAGPEPVKKKRGRPPGAGTGKTPKVGLADVRQVLDAKELAPKIQGLHAMLALMTGQPVFNIDEAEAAQLASAISKVSEHYDLNIMSGPKAALINLAAIAGMIYVPRVFMLVQSRKMKPASMPSTPEDAINMAAQTPINFGEETADTQPKGTMTFN